MHLDTITRGQTLECPRTGRTGTVLTVDKDGVRLQLGAGGGRKGKRINVLADQKEIRWRAPRRSRLTLRALGVR